MEFEGVSDELWDSIEPLLPPSAKEGRPRADDRRTMGAILYVLKTGRPWNDLPKKYGDDVTAWRRLKEWEDRGVWKRITSVLAARKYAAGVSSTKRDTRLKSTKGPSGSKAQRSSRGRRRPVRVAMSYRREGRRRLRARKANRGRVEDGLLHKSTGCLSENRHRDDPASGCIARYPPYEPELLREEPRMSTNEKIVCFRLWSKVHAPSRWPRIADATDGSGLESLVPDHL